jgi:ABC-type phosphate/phosphonate transport system ATPase subunit
MEVSMPEPLTLVVGGFLAGFLGDVVANVAASKVEHNLLDVFLDKHINHDIQKSLRDAWIASCDKSFKTYRASPDYARLPGDERILVEERAKLFRAPQTIQALFPAVDDPSALLTSGDVARLFIASHHDTNRQMIAAIDQQGLWDGLPGGLQNILNQLLLHGLMFEFIEFAIKREPKARDALFFQQFVALRQTTDGTEAELLALRDRVIAQFEQTESYQCWQREVISRIESQLDGVSYKLTQMGVDISEQLQEIAEFVQGSRVPHITLHYHGNVVAQKASIPTMLRDRQSYHLARPQGLDGHQEELDKVRAFLHTQQCGYVLVSGPQGCGKSTLLAELIAAERDLYLWCFINAQDNTHTPAGFLRQMCEQMLAYYQMPVQHDKVLTEPIERLEALYARLLHMPLVRDDQQMVLVIDGVDQAADTFMRSLHIPPDLPMGKFIVFSVSSDRRHIIKKLSLPPDNLLEITLSAPKCTVARSRTLPVQRKRSEGIPMQPSDVNPFEYGTSVPPERFYGRARQRTDVRHRIGGISAQCISIVGMRRSGKSSLLRYIKERSQEFCLPTQQAILVSLDFQNNRYQTPEGVVEGLRRSIERETGVTPWQENEEPFSDNVEDGLACIRDSGHRLIVLIDEFEAISKRLDKFQDWAEDWRSKASSGNLFALVIASKRPLEDIYVRCGLTSNFPNIFTRTILGAMESESWQQLVQDGFAMSEKTLQQADIALTDVLAGGLPFYTQMAASLLWQYADHQQVRKAFIAQVKYHFRELWGSFNESEQEALRQIAAEPGATVNLDGFQNKLEQYGLLRPSGHLFSSVFTAFVGGSI